MLLIWIVLYMEVMFTTVEKKSFSASNTVNVFMYTLD